MKLIEVLKGEEDVEYITLYDKAFCLHCARNVNLTHPNNVRIVNAWDPSYGVTCSQCGCRLDDWHPVSPVQALSITILYARDVEKGLDIYQKGMFPTALLESQLCVFFTRFKEYQKALYYGWLTRAESDDDSDDLVGEATAEDLRQSTIACLQGDPQGVFNHPEHGAVFVSGGSDIAEIEAVLHCLVEQTDINDLTFDQVRDALLKAGVAYGWYKVEYPNVEDIDEYLDDEEATAES